MFTGTYRQDGGDLPDGRTVSKDFNRFIQRFRRFGPYECEYLRVLEKHRSGALHLHAILQFQRTAIPVYGNRYFDKIIYGRWKALWTQGHSDFRPAGTLRVGGLIYILKYLVKNSTKNTIWKKILPKDEGNAMPHAKEVRPREEVPQEKQARKDPLPIYYEGAKICSWSRNFDFTPFMISPTKTVETMDIVFGFQPSRPIES